MHLVNDRCNLPIESIGSRLSILVASSEGFYNCYTSYTLGT